MAVVQIERIKIALQKKFSGRIDMSDYDGQPEEEKEKAFLSRALAAYTLTMFCDIDEDTAARGVTDGFHDGGIDLIHFDKNNERLFLGQSKWSEKGSGSVSKGDCLKFVDGCGEVVNLRLEHFNAKVKSREPDLLSAVRNADVHIVLFVTYSGNQPLSSDVRRVVEQFLEKMNDTGEVFSFETLSQAHIYDAIVSHSQRHSINLEIMLHEWGQIKEPHPAFYGQVDAACIAGWWREHGRSLFARNIRNFKGSTSVNDSIATTLRDEPQHFQYFNNGITVLCRRIAKQPVGGMARDCGVFTCEGINVVNGAQTVGVIGMAPALLGRGGSDARVFVRLVSLASCPEGFDKTITRATNTQNRIEGRDFAALDHNQQRLATEFALDNWQYTYKAGDPSPPPEKGFGILEATVSLACDADIALAVQAKREVGRLWDDIEGEPYTLLFNESTNARDVRKAVEILRTVESRLKVLATTEHPRAGLVAVHGNRLILHRVFRDSRVRPYKRESARVDDIKRDASEATTQVFLRVVEFLESRHRGAYPASFFKNLQRCKELNDWLESVSQSQCIPTKHASEGSTAPLEDADSGLRQKTFLDD